MAVSSDSFVDRNSIVDHPSRRSNTRVVLSDGAFYAAMIVLGGTYIVLIVLMLLADVAYMSNSSVAVAQQADTWQTALAKNPMVRVLADRNIQYAAWLTLGSCTLSAVGSLWVAVPLGYLLSRHRFPGRQIVDAIVDIPIVLPPLVVGLSLLILFMFAPFRWIQPWVVFQLPAVIIAQMSVACGFAVRTMKTTFDHINPRCEQVAMALGCTKLQAFGWVVLPEARRGMTTAFTMAWARSLGEFGPILVFASATRMKTEVLSTSVFLEFSVGNIDAALAISLLMVLAAVLVLIITRVWGTKESFL